MNDNYSVLKDTIDMLFGLDDSKLMEIQSFIRENSEEADMYKNLYKPLTEAELIDKIDRSLAHLNDGTAMDAKEFIRELSADYGL